MPSASRSTTTTTSTATATDHVPAVEEEVTLHLVGEADPRTSQQHWEFAGPYDPAAVDPDRYPAANDPDWDYATGNPPNPVWQGQNLSSRTNRSSRTYILMAGVNVVGVSPALCSALDQQVSSRNPFIDILPLTIALCAGST